MSEKISFLFTVFTPTYNREKVLHRVYQSLLEQRFRDFEWLIIDDGSTDRTKELVEVWQKDKATWFPIRYIWQKNQHKKSAHNHGVKEARGTLFLPLDSDDYCTPEALERFSYHWFAIPASERDKFSAVTALCADESGVIVGDRFTEKEWLDSDSLELRYRFGITGEKWGFQRVDVLKKFLFPENISGHVPESVVWSQIARQFKTRFINEVLRIYCQDSTGDVQQITNEGDIKRNAAGHFFWKQCILSNDIIYFRYRPLSFILDAARLTRFYLHTPKQYHATYWPSSILGKLLTFVMLPIGVIWWLYESYSK
jgi:glycosyltransferase involved in cell wall biosynthesis